MDKLGADSDESEIKFARKLASGESKKRNHAIKGLKAWLQARSSSEPKGVLPDLELRKLWRGLFFCMWLADKAPVQNELAGKIAGLVHCFKSVEGVRSWLLVCGRTLREEWGRLDKYRLDKFYVLIRRVVSESFEWLHAVSWDAAAVSAVGVAMDDAFFVHPQPNGIRLHTADLFLDELFKNKASAKGAFVPEAGVLLSLLGPLLTRMASTEDKIFFARTMENVVLALPSKLAESSKPKSDASLHLAPVQALIFELASAASTRDIFRKDLYSAHGIFQSSTGLKAGLKASSSNVSAKSSLEEGGKPARKRSPEPEETVEIGDVAEVSTKKKKKKKQKRSDEEEEKGGEKQVAVPVVEVDQAEKEKNKRVSFGSNKSKVYVKSVKDLKESNPLLSPPPKGVLSVGKPETPKSLPRRKTSAKKMPKTSTPRGKASDFF